MSKCPSEPYILVIQLRDVFRRVIHAGGDGGKFQIYRRSDRNRTMNTNM